LLRSAHYSFILRLIPTQYHKNTTIDLGDSNSNSISDTNTNTNTNICVVKPHRGVASDGVHLCFSEAQAQRAFDKLLGISTYGGGRNDKVLVQEFAVGQEYALDTVARDGEIKVVAIWRYHKRAANGAPFCYQAAELLPYTAELEGLVDYSVKVLTAAGSKWGPTHTEVVMTRDGPRIIEVNPRWHAAKFRPIAQVIL
jgi:biotin carboxylase